MELAYIFGLNPKACKGLWVQIPPSPRTNYWRLTMINTGWIPGYLQTTGRMLHDSSRRGGGCGGPRKDDDDDDEEISIVKILLYLLLFFGLIGLFFFLLCVMFGG